MLTRTDCMHSLIGSQESPGVPRPLTRWVAETTLGRGAGYGGGWMVSSLQLGWGGHISQVQGGSREVLAAEKTPWKGMGDDIWALLWVSARHYRWWGVYGELVWLGSSRGDSRMLIATEKKDEDGLEGEGVGIWRSWQRSLYSVCPCPELCEGETSHCWEGAEKQVLNPGDGECWTALV